MATTRRAIAIMFVITAVALVAGTLATFIFGSRLLALRAETTRNQMAITQLQGVLSSLKDAETGQRGYLLTGDEKYLGPFHQAQRQLAPSPTGILPAGDDMPPSERAEILQLINDEMVELEKTIELYRTGHTGEAIAIVRSGSGKTFMDRLRSMLGRVQATLEEKLKRDEEAAERMSQIRTMLFALAGAGTVAILSWSYVRVDQAMGEQEAALLIKYQGSLPIPSRAEGFGEAVDARE